MKDFSLQLLIDTLNSDTEQNFYLKLYSILTLEAVFSIRPELAIEELIQIPTSLNTLINLLDDENVQIKNETLLLLTSLVDNESKIGYDTTHLKSLIVFEGVFSKLFNIILDEKEDAIVKNDCFVLINSLIKYNTMNQRIFIEDSTCLENIIKILLKYLNSNYQWVVSSDTEEDLEMLNNIICIINSLVEEDTDITTDNQNHLFNNSNIGMILLQLSFKSGVLLNYRIAFLDCVSRIIKGNASLQEKFGSIDIPLIDPLSSSNNISATSSQSESSVVLPAYKVLLNWSTKLSSVHALKLRMVSNELLKSYLFSNLDIQKDFINHQAKEYEDSVDIQTNIFAGLLDYDSSLLMDSYKLYFILDLIIFLFDQNPENKDLILHQKDSTNFIETILELLLTHLNSKALKT